MRKAILFLICILFAASSFALNEDLIYDVEEVKSRLTISSTFDIDKTGAGHKVSYASVNLSFVPSDRENQDVLDVRYDPEPDSVGNEVIYKWYDSGLGEYNFLMEAELKNNVNLKKVKGKIKFPIQDLDEDYEKYTKSTENIDADDPEIIKMASEIASGQDDLYVVVFELVNWIKSNVEYSLNTLTAEVSQKSSWVLKNRYGVCDEITSLFVAMARSLGIPARYISGMAYTNWNDMNDWGPHAWTEVYFPGYGWVAFDITYGEFGYVDATHIVLKEALDSDESATHYEWRGRNIDLDASELDIKVELLDKKGHYGNVVDADVDILKDNVGFGSYNLVEVEVKNLKDYYVAEEFALAKVDEIKVIGDERKQVLLKPYEKKKLHWIIKLDGDFDPGFIYTFPIKAYTPRNNSGEAEFSSSVKDKFYDRDEIDDALDLISEEEKKTYSREVDLSCVLDSGEDYYMEEEITVLCAVTNKGNVLMDDLNVCVSDDCQKIDLGISQEKALTFTKKPEEVGNRELAVTAKNKDISKAAYLKYKVLDEPLIKIDELEHPHNVEYGQEFSVSFIIDKLSFSNPKDIVVSVSHNGIPQEWMIDELNNSEEFVVNLNADMLGGGENDLNVKIVYEDERNNRYSVDEDFVIEVIATKFFDKVKLWMNDVEFFFRRVFSKIFK